MTITASSDWINAEKELRHSVTFPSVPSERTERGDRGPPQRNLFSDALASHLLKRAEVTDVSEWPEPRPSGLPALALPFRISRRSLLILLILYVPFGLALGEPLSLLSLSRVEPIHPFIIFLYEAAVSTQAPIAPQSHAVHFALSYSCLFFFIIPFFSLSLPLSRFLFLSVSLVRALSLEGIAVMQVDREDCLNL